MLSVFRLTGLQLVAAGAGFAVILAGWLGVLIWWQARRREKTDRFERRLGLVDESKRGARVLRLWQDGQEATIYVSNITMRPSLIGRLEALRNEAGLSVSLAVLGGVVACVAAVVFIAMVILTHQVLAGLAGAAATLMGAWIWLKRAVSKRAALFDRQLVDAMDLAQRSLKAGHPLVAAFQLVAAEIDESVGGLFSGICEQQELGADLEQALRAGAARCTSEDMKLFATCVAMQARSGGNLASMIERLAEVIRDRIKLGRRVRVLTSQTQFSKRVLIGLPIALFVLLNALNPAYMEPLYSTSTGQMLLCGAGVSVLMGTWVMGRMIKLGN